MPLPDNDKFNVDFVQVIEEFPVLYNYNLKTYSNRNEQDKAWRAVAARYQGTDSGECKLRWKVIRGGFTRYLKSRTTTGSGAKKQYYLWDALQFLLPYTKSRNQSGNLSVKTPPANQEISQNNEEILQGANDQEEITDQPVQPDNDVLLNIPQSAQASPASTPSSSLSAWRGSKAKEKRVDPLENVVTQYLKRKISADKPIDNNPNLDFFKSLLPDISNFAPAKKRLFKRKVIDIIDELSDDNMCVSPGDSARSSTSTPMSHQSSLLRASTQHDSIPFSGPSGRPNEEDLLSEDASEMYQMLSYRQNYPQGPTYLDM